MFLVRPSFARVLNPLTVCLLSALGMVFSAPLWADDAAKAAREHEQRVQEDQQRLQEKLRTEIPTKDVFLQPTTAASEQTTSTDNTCATVSLIVVQGVNVIDMALVDKITKPYLNHCLTLASINQIVKEISTLYLDKGYITSRAYVQPQGLQKGTLDILVVEGKLEQLKSSDNHLTPRQLQWAFPATEGKIVNLRDLEQGIEQLNRLQQNSAALDIQPGTNTGDSVVAISDNKSRPLHAGASLDNSGSDATGKTVASVSVSWDNPLAINDSFYLTLSDALRGKPDAQSRSYAMAYSIPSGYALFNLSATYFDYQQPVEGAGTTFMTSGSTRNQSLGVDYMLYRGQRDKLLVSTNFTHKLSNNYLEDVFLDTSSYALDIADTGFTYTYKRDEGLWHSSFKVYKSLDILDAKTTLSAAEKAYQFTKFTLDVGLSQAFDLFGKQWLYLGSAQYLYSPDNLLASEGLAIGNRYTVRGIEGESLSGNKGGYIRNELSYPTLFAFGAHLDPYLGLDVGAANAPDYQKSTTPIAGAVLGVRYASAYVSADCSYATALKTPDFLNADQHAVYLSLRVSM